MSAPFYRSERMIPGLRVRWPRAATGTSSIPAEVIDWLARLRLLHGVPFAYLVPDADLLPPESVRFFYLDRDWTDAARSRSPVNRATQLSIWSTVQRCSRAILAAPPTISRWASVHSSRLQRVSIPNLRRLSSGSLQL